ncbi:MAG: hypothetical protein RL260_1919 [Pseudomonadota bacterium]|jgi:translation elongation factor EF-Tu-like GTPase
MTTSTHYATVKRPGHRDHEMRVISAHATQSAASKAASKDASLCVVKTAAPVAKGATLWDDVNGRTAWSAV